MIITNTSGINLPLGVWLLHDEYDYVDKDNYISATSLMKPVRQTVLTSRIPVTERQADVADYIARTMGHAVHDSIERAWTRGYQRSMRLLGYPQHVIDKVLINPTDEQLAATPGAIPVYLEQRAFREIDGFTIGGKFDMVADGVLFDNKSTSAYSWLFGTRDKDHQLQGSIYKWLNPDKITSDHITINYIFTDWSRMQAKSNPKYPQKRVEEKHIPLMSVQETENWIRNRLRQIKASWALPENQIPECTPEELWQSEPTYKFYADRTKTSGRSTRNFDNKAEAEQFAASKGGNGIVITIPGEAKACNYCQVFDVCTQKDRYL